MAAWDSAIEDLFGSFDRDTLRRGREYAADGRVTVVDRFPGGLNAKVRGSETYDVAFHWEATKGEGSYQACNCPAFDKTGECKHIAAVAYVLTGLPGGGEAPRGRNPLEKVGALPAMFKSVYSANSVLNRLGLYTSEKPDDPAFDRWMSLADWWGRTRDREHLTKQVSAIAMTLERLRTWLPPPRPKLPTTGYEILCAQLAELYAERASGAEIRHALPGPLDERHPGWLFSFDPKRRVLEIAEKPSALYEKPLKLALGVAVVPGAPLRFEHQAFTSYAGADAWEIFALRALIEALHARKDDTIKALEQELARPLWEHVLDDIAQRPGKADDTREWAFAIATTYNDYAFTVTAFSRNPSGRSQKWKKQSFDQIFVSERTDELLERDIARVALCSVEARNESTLRIATPQGHELARLLAKHPRTYFSSTRGASLDEPHRGRIIVGTLKMHLDPAVVGGALEPKLFIDDEPLPCAPNALVGNGMFRGYATFDNGEFLVASAQVPTGLRAWLDALGKMGDTFSFPAEAVPKLAATTQSLAEAGHVSLPRAALGEELAPEPRAALRIEWRPDTAIVEPLVEVYPGAPLVAAGAGAKLFTFVLSGKRVFVERRLEDENAFVETALEAIEAPIGWTMSGGVASGIQDMLALAAWCDANPLGLAIEVKKGGRSPEVIALEDARSRIQVSRRGSWLKLDGELDVNGVKLTIGDILEAARHARRYVKAADGVFVELSVETVKRLQPVAIAAELAPANDTGTPQVHDAFGGLLAEAVGVFGDVKTKDVDLGAYAKRFTARTKATKVPPLEKGELRPYQHDGAEWMLQLATWAPGCVLADDMGLGKTVQTASVLKARQKLGPALIIAPASVSSNWVSELARFMPTLDVRWFNAERDSLDGDVVVVSYGLLQRAREQFQAKKWSTVVVDEAQYVKNSGARRTDTVRSLERDFTIALTGTPLENHLGELFSIIDIVFPSLLGDADTFREQFRRPIETKKDPDRLEALSRLISPFLLRRTRSSVLRELPPREEITEKVELSKEEQKVYLALRKACEEQFTRKRKKGETPAQTRIALLAALTRLRQLACDPRLVDKTYDGPTTKVSRVVELTTEIAAEGNRTLVFSQFTTFLDYVKDALEAAGLRVGYLAGSTPTEKRKQLVDDFQEGKFDVFCISLLAGGTGLNLTAASYVVHLDPWWNPAAEEQATSRAHRMGQLEPVTVYRLVARGTIEEAVLEMHDSKKKLASAVLDGKGEAKAVSEDELIDLLRFGA